MSLAVVACDDDSTGPKRNDEPALDLVIGDIEGDSGSCSPQTLAGANSINVVDGVASAETLLFPGLSDTTGTVTTLSFVFDLGGQGTSVVFCNLAGDDLESDGTTANGPNLIKPWRITGLTPGGQYTMSFTGGGRGSPNRSIRIFVDVDGNGTLEASEVEDLIGPDGVTETRVFGQTITADASGVILGEYWGGSTNESGQNGAWRGWTIASAP